MKKLFALMLSLMMALSLVACSTSEADETEDTNEVVELDTNVYVALGSEELDLGNLVLLLEDYDYASIEIDQEKSDYDLSVAGEYTLVVILTDAKAETTEVNLTLVVNEQDEEEEAILEVTTKLTSKDSTLDAISSLTEETTLDLVVDNNNPVATKLASKTTTITAAKYQVFSNLQLISKLTNKNSTLNVVLSMVEETETTSGSYSSSYSNGWNGGLNTDPTVYGLDPNNIWVQEAMKLLGKTGLCSDIDIDLYNAVYYALYGEDWSSIISYNYVKNASWSEISSQLQVGDRIFYNYMKSGSSTIRSHVATYLGNGLALHGNWTGGVARIANVYQEARSYHLYSTTHTISCSSCTASSEIDRAEYEAITADYTPDMCEVTIAEQIYMLYTPLYKWCSENYRDIFYGDSDDIDD